MRRTVVVVDDLPELRQILRLILEHGGPFRVVGEGDSGDAAVALAADLHPDLLLLDVEMPGGPSGWEVLPRIRDAAPETAVVILSGSRADPAAVASQGLAAAVLEKGMPPKELNAALIELLGADPLPAATGDPSSAPIASSRDGSLHGLDGFASVAGHDLAQPLQVAYGYLEMLRADYGAALDETGVRWLDAAVTSLERMRGLVQEILTFARSGSGALRLDDVDLGAAVEEAATGLSGLEVRSGDLPTVRADANHLVEVLRRLFANAAAFAPDGRPAVVTVEAEAAAGAAGWVVTVADDGDGVPEALRDRLFEPFQRGASPGGRGAGLGLAVAAKLVEAHAGRLWLEPTPPGAGAVFRFSLPRPSSG